MAVDKLLERIMKASKRVIETGMKPVPEMISYAKYKQRMLQSEKNEFEVSETKAVSGPTEDTKGAPDGSV